MTKVGRAALVVLLAALSACGGTSIKEPDKTMVLHNSIYNVSKVTQFTSFVQGTLTSGEEMDLSRTKRGDFNDLLDASPRIRVVTGWNLDDQQVVFESRDVEKWGDFKDARGKFEDANGKLVKFMSNDKTQLEL